jgi:hypothetical protein
MAYYNEYDQLVETDEERKKREAEQQAYANNYAAGQNEYGMNGGVQPEQPSFGNRLGQALTQAGTNVVNNIKQIPENVVRNVQAIPGQVNQNIVAAANRIAPQVAQPQQPVAPVNPQQYNMAIAQQESGNRPNIGYHDLSKSTAAGLYGLTAGAYNDARKLNPNLPADITQATPEQQTQAMNSYTQQNAKYLQGYGIEPNQNTLAAAHFLGAKGLSDYLKTGYISPQAAQVNGGAENVKRIVDQRLGGQAVATSGASQMPTAVPGEGVAVATGQGVQGTMSMNQPPEQPAPISPYSLSTGVNPMGLGTQQQRMMQPAPSVEPTIQAASNYQLAQDDPNALFKIGFDENQPEYLRNRAKDRALELYNNQKTETKASEIIPTLTPSQIADSIKNGKAPKGEDTPGIGTWLQYLLLKHVGLNDMANDVGQKLGIGHAWQNAVITDENGKEKTVEVLTSANGKVLKGNFAGTNIALSPDQLSEATNELLGKGVHVTKVENRINPQTGEVVHVQTLSNGNERFKLGGKAYTGDKSVLIPEAQHTKQEDTRVNAGYSNLSKLTSMPTQQQRYEALRSAGVSPKRIEQELGLPEGSLSKKAPTTTTATTATPATTTTPATTATPATPATTTTPATPAAGYIPPKTAEVAQNPAEEPTQRLGESNEVFKARLKTWETKNKLQQKDAEEFSKKAVDIRSTLNKFREGVDVIDSGNHNLGPNFSLRGAGPLPKVQQFFGEQFGTDDSANTAMLRSLITRGGLEGIKNYMGPAISNFDVQTWMKNNPITESSPPQAIRAWLQKTHDAMLDAAEIQRKNALNQGMIEPSFSLGNKISQPTQSSTTMSPADLARAEIERRKNK